jgi:hypothetical protein
LLVEILPKDNLKTPTVYRQLDSLVNYSPKTQGVGDNGLLLKSLYLQKMSKYLHLTNTSDLNLDHTLSLNTNYLYLYNTFRGELKDLNFMIFFSVNNKFNLKPATTFTTLNRESLFYRCINNEKLISSRSYILNANVLRTLPFIFQKEFNKVIKRNLTLGKENK